MGKHCQCGKQTPVCVCVCGLTLQGVLFDNNGQKVDRIEKSGISRDGIITYTARAFFLFAIQRQRNAPICAIISEYTVVESRDYFMALDPLASPQTRARAKMPILLLCWPCCAQYQRTHQTHVARRLRHPHPLRPT